MISILKAFGRAKYLSLILASMALGLAFTLTGLIGSGIAGAAGTPVLALDDYQHSYPLGRYLDIFKDKTAKLGINEASSPQEDRFVPFNGQDRNLGFSRSAFWLRATVWQKMSPRAKDEPPPVWVIRNARRFIYRFTLHATSSQPEAGEQNWTKTESGQWGNWRFNHDICLPLAVKLPHDLRRPTTIYVRIGNFTPITLNLSILTSESLLS